ncbi:hypothetical protein SKAU_G00324210 [Synaphobranchus kaupii]|uniref:Uncharacterized protein n=1 Tax=Synaphobranchus kaupii TaxID=118154 RepID=A0A9Q1IHY6_SYNKA|nr:hypothetical protein SKAU_G00324210 [Synaphobranchus kaupii]
MLGQRCVSLRSSENPSRRLPFRFPFAETPPLRVPGVASRGRRRRGERWSPFIFSLTRSDSESLQQLWLNCFEVVWLGRQGGT